MVNWFKYSLIFIGIILLCSGKDSNMSDRRWGFFGHKRINRMATFVLPPSMFGFYKTHIEYLTEHSVDPDKRRYA
jgi:hypothetical protein